MTKIRSTTFESGTVCGVVEGSTTDVDRYLRNSRLNADRGKTRFVNSKDGLVTNGSGTVKVTTYEPVHDPLGVPSMNELFDDAPEIGDQKDQPSDYQQQKAPQAIAKPMTKKKPGLFIGNTFGIVGKPPTTNNNGSTLGLPNMGWDEPAETASTERSTNNAAPQSEQQQNKRQGKPLGLPKSDFT